MVKFREILEGKTPNPVRERIFFILKILISVLIFVLILKKIDVRQMLAFWSNLTPAKTVSLLMLLMANLLLQFLRWRVIVSNHLTDISNSAVLKSLFSGFALRLVFPGGYAEIGKILLLQGRRSHRVIAFGAEKYITAVTQFFLIALSGWILFPSYRIGWGISGGIALLSGLFYPYLPHIGFLKKFMNGREHFFSSLCKVSLTTFLIYIMVTLQYRLILPSDISIDLISLFCAVMFLIGAAMIPVSFSGLGLREGMGIFIFSHFGIPPEQVVGMTLSIFFCNMLLPSILGGIVILLEKRKGVHV